MCVYIYAHQYVCTVQYTQNKQVDGIQGYTQ